MKKLFKTIAAISATAMLALPANLTANAYIVNSRNFTDGKAMVNKSTDGGRGQRWEYFDYQQDLPRFDQSFLNWKGDYTYLAPVAPKELNSTEYGNCDMLATLDRNVAKSSDIAKARAYVDNIHVKRSNGHQYAVVMEYSNNSHEDSFIGTSRESRIDYMVVDYGLRMLEGPYLQDIISKMYSESSDTLSYNYMRSNSGYTCYLYLDNYYIAGMRLTSSDPYTKFYTPVLEKHPSGRGFRTKIECHISTPSREGDIVFGSTSGYYNFNVLSNVKMTCNGSGMSTIDNYTKLNIKQQTISVPKSAFDVTNSTYTGLLTSEGLMTRISGTLKENFKKNYFLGATLSNGVLNIYVGKQTYIGDPDWKSGDPLKQFKALIRNGYQDLIGRCPWIDSQLHNNSSIRTVRFYRECTPNSTGRQFYTTTPYELRKSLYPWEFY